MSRTSKAAKRPEAVLKLPEYEVPRLLTYTRRILRCMTGNAWFPVPEPPLSAIEAATEALSEAEIATRTRTVGTVATRDEKRRALRVLLQQLLRYIQRIADENPDDAVSIIESSGVFVKDERVSPVRGFRAKRGATEASVKLLAPSAGDRAGYEWAHSVDGGETWSASASTRKASFTVTGLKPGTTAHFRYRVVTDGPGDWSQTVAFIVT